MFGNNDVKIEIQCLQCVHSLRLFSASATFLVGEKSCRNRNSPENHDDKTSSRNRNKPLFTPDKHRIFLTNIFNYHIYH